MKRFVFVRHSQASALAANYDQVSPLGYLQAQALAKHWLGGSEMPSRIYTGTLQRHLQTLGEIRSTLAEAEVEWPQAIELRELDEHAGTGLVERLLPQFAESDPKIAAFVEAPPKDRDQLLRTYFGFFRTITRRWALGEFSDAGIEHWLGFRSRVRAALDRLIDATADGETTLVITSGGPVAAVAGTALELGELRTLELSWIVHNTAMAELFLRPGEPLRLKSFNRTPHLTPELHTYV